MKQKHFMDIENLREEDTELRKGNGYGFEVGDIIQITEKWDGSNSSIAYDTETDSLIAFSRKQELSFNNILNGFWNYAQSLNKDEYKDVPNYRIFGEWGNRNKIIYNPEWYKKWYVYDIYDVEKECWMPQDVVKLFCKDHNLIYIHELYYGEFISWEHCRSFMNSPAYGDRQEGVVVKNMTKLNNLNSRQPFYLKIVNHSFKETMKHHEKVIDPVVENAKKEAQNIVDSIVTRNRVEKELFKMRDEQIVPEKLTPNDMKLVARNLPKRIYDDCVKEENELVLQCGEYFSKACSATVMRLAKEIILG